MENNQATIYKNLKEDLNKAIDSLEENKKAREELEKMELIQDYLRLKQEQAELEAEIADAKIYMDVPRMLACNHIFVPTLSDRHDRAKSLTCIRCNLTDEYHGLCSPARLSSSYHERINYALLNTPADLLKPDLDWGLHFYEYITLYKKAISENDKLTKEEIISKMHSLLEQERGKGYERCHKG